MSLHVGLDVVGLNEIEDLFGDGASKCLLFGHVRQVVRKPV
jgi:hypothetical protein